MPLPAAQSSSNGAATLPPSSGQASITPGMKDQALSAQQTSPSSVMASTPTPPQGPNPNNEPTRGTSATTTKQVRLRQRNPSAGPQAQQVPPPAPPSPIREESPDASLSAHKTMIGSFMGEAMKNSVLHADSRLSRTAASLLMGPHSFDSNPTAVPPPGLFGSQRRKSSDFEYRGLPQFDEEFGVSFGAESADQPRLDRLDSDELSSFDPYGADQDDPDHKSRRRSSPPVFTLRSREQIVIHFLMELRMLRTDWAFTLFGTVFQFLHSVFTNLAYYYHAKLTAAQRVPLSDMAFDALPAITGSWWMASEYLVYGMVFVTIGAIVSILVVRWNAPHGRPMFCMQIARRILMTLMVCQTLRIVSFMITTLPGASRQCVYHVPEELTAKEMLNGPAPDAGNPSGWAPPKTWFDIVFRMDATNGCGDLMFSSHTIFTMLFVCIIFKYFNWTWLKRTFVLVQIAIVPFILASHKHYSVDVFTAIYVTPLVFEALCRYFPDRASSTELAHHYRVRFYLSPAGVGFDSAGYGFAYVAGMWGREYYVEPEDLPLDLRNRRRTSSMDADGAPVKVGAGLGSSTSAGWPRNRLYKTRPRSGSDLSLNSEPSLPVVV